MALLTSCATPIPGSARPAVDAPAASIEPSTDGDELPSDGAPNVANPLEISRFVQDPCLALTAAQAQQLTLPPAGKPSDGALGKACGWSNWDDSVFVDVNMINKNPEGLSALYRANKQGKYKFFEPLPLIEGFPAVAYDVTDTRKDGSCPVAVGAANDLSFEVTMQVGKDEIGKKDPCEAAATVAALMLRTMKGS